ncbi:hypothetical protein RDI58_024278 [Solanum bulbocastanum]|uniref:Uncharacterized protein n=1 Tax=Solanum bulbocastanum TaxID=147425 RepID=A0AAN8SXD3_SOLBU
MSNHEFYLIHHTKLHYKDMWNEILKNFEEDLKITQRCSEIQYV